MEQKELEIKELLVNKKLEDIEFYIINPKYFSPDPEHTWIIDGGVQMNIDGQQHTFGWSEEFQFFNFFEGAFSEQFEFQQTESMDAKNSQEIKALIGQTITDVQTKLNFYYEYDDNYEIIDEKKYMPFEMVLSFENGSSLQISAVIFTAQHNEIKDLYYDSQGRILVSLNKTYEVQMPEGDGE